MERRRVVVTGMGMVSPVGNHVAEAWGNVLEGQNGIGPIDLFDSSQHTVHFAGQVKNFDSSAHINPKDARRMDRVFTIWLGCWLRSG